MTRSFVTILTLALVLVSLYVAVPQARVILDGLREKAKTFTTEIVETSREIPLVKEITDTIPKEKDPLQTPGGLMTGGEVEPSQTTNIKALGIVSATNKERKANGKKELTVNTKLTKSAQYKAEDMLTRQYFDHVGPNNETISVIISKEGYEYIIIGENLAMGGFTSAEEIVTAWMNSPGHRANILNERYTEIGIGIAVGTYKGKRVLMAVQHFGLPKSTCPAIDESLKTQSTELQKELQTLETTINTLKKKIDSDSKKGISSKNDIDQYNALVAEYNRKIRETESIIQSYNKQVREFNTCASVS